MTNKEGPTIERNTDGSFTVRFTEEQKHLLSDLRSEGKPVDVILTFFPPEPTGGDVTHQVNNPRIPVQIVTQDVDNPRIPIQVVTQTVEGREPVKVPIRTQPVEERKTAKISVTTWSEPVEKHTISATVTSEPVKKVTLRLPYKTGTLSDLHP